MVYVSNSDNYCYLHSSVVLLDDSSMTSFAFVYSKLKQKLIKSGAALNSQLSTWAAVDQWHIRLRTCVRAKGGHFELVF